MYAIFCRRWCAVIQDIVVRMIRRVDEHKQSCVVAGAFYSSDEYIKCLCADQSGKKLKKTT